MMSEERNPSEVSRIVGNRTEPELCLHASGEALKKATLFNEMLQSAFPYGRMICCKKGIYRFKTHEEANQHQERYMADTMAMIKELSNSQKDVRVDESQPLEARPATDRRSQEADLLVQ